MLSRMGQTANKAKGKKRSKGLWHWVFVISITVLVGSIVALGVIAFSYFQGQQKYDKVAQMANFDVKEAAQPEDLGKLTVDWDALRKANEDVVAWVYVPNTKINYPVVKGRDNEYYLTRDFDGDAGWLANYGAIFMDYRNSANFQDEGNFIYGHNMNDGSMFADVAHMADQKRFDECRTVYLLTPSGNFRLRSFALVHCGGDDPIVQTTFADAHARAAYAQDKIDRSVVYADDIKPVDEIDRIVALSTCDDYSSGRFLLFCYIVDEAEPYLKGEVGIETAQGEATGFKDQIADRK